MTLLVHPIHDADGIKIYNAHVLDGLRSLPDRAVQVIATSPPYWGLRSYATDGQIWQGDKPLCADGAHEWRDESFVRRSNDNKGKRGNEKQYTSVGTFGRDHPTASMYCAKCNAWRGELGSEPTPELYVEHMVQIFREARRVLRDDGLLWLNLGASYWAGKGQSAQKGGAHQEKRHARGASLNRGYQTVGGGKGITRPADGKHPLFKPKDLVMIPHMVALAMQADGWVLRNEVLWLKRNCMPQSMNDRLTVSHEAVFLFSKSKHYFYDVDAVRVAQAVETAKRYTEGFGTADKKQALVAAGAYHTGANGRDNLSGAMEFNPAGRQLRTKDFFDTALDELIEGQRAWLAHLEDVRERGGILLDDEGLALALLVTTSAYKGAHFAVFSEKLVTPMLKLSTSAFGRCAKCGAPYKRVVKKGLTAHDGTTATKSDLKDSNAGRLALLRQAARERGGEYVNERETVGWEANCGCAMDDGDYQEGDFEIIETPTGMRAGDDPSLEIGRAGYARPRGENEGRRPMTRYEQRKYAAQLKASPQQTAMKKEAGRAFAHYVRTDKAGARPIPPALLEQWLERGWLTRVELPIQVMDALAGGANGNGANTGANNKEPYQKNNPHRMRLYNSKYDNGGKHGQATNGFQRTRSIETERDESRERAALLFPNDARAQQDYVNFIHDHGAVPARETIGWEKDCGHKHAEVAPCVVMDIFHGAGTTMLAAWRLGLDYIGLDLNREYVDLSLQRLADEKVKAEKEKQKAARANQNPAQPQRTARRAQSATKPQTPIQMAFGD